MHVLNDIFLRDIYIQGLALDIVEAAPITVYQNVCVHRSAVYCDVLLFS